MDAKQDGSKAYSPEAYRELLALIRQQGYACRLFSDPPPAAGKTIYLRHDIDYSPEIALEFARINAEAGAVGTFFFQLRSKIYNLLAAPTLEIVRHIQQCGQKIGFHFILPPELPQQRTELAERIRADFDIVAGAVAGLEPVFSWHNPSTFPGLIEKHLEFEVPGLVHTYNRYFFKEVPYFSDSDLRYTVAEFREILTAGHECMQLLFHPFEWVCGGDNMIRVLARTWPHIIRAREQGTLENKVYRKHLPAGMPGALLDEFACGLARAGGAAHAAH